MKTLFFFISLCLFICTTHAQDKIKYGKISPEDLAMKVYPADTEAVAVVLSNIGTITFNEQDQNYPVTEERHVVIKLLKAPALDRYGNVAIYYYARNNISRVGNIKGIVHLPDGTQVKLDNSLIFDEVTNDYISAKKIAFPKLVPGAIIEYQYVIISNRMFEPVDWYFQAEIPIRYTELVTRFPEWFDYLVLTQGLPLYKQKREVVPEVNLKYVHSTFINKDVPALKEECCITTMSDYFSRVRFRLNTIQNASGVPRPVLNSWKTVANELFSGAEWGGFLRNKRSGELVLEAAGIKPMTYSTQLEAAKAIYDYINNNIQWNNYYSYSTWKDVNQILKEKSGSSGDLNKLMCAALLQSGIQAQPIFVSTRDNGKLLELYPFLDQFNHMVIKANIDGKEMWIDAGIKNLPIGTLRPEALNSRGWVVNEDNPVWVDIKPADSKTVFLVKGDLQEDGLLTADVEARFTGYHALEQRNEIKETKEKYGTNLLTGNGNIKVTSMELINNDDPTLPLQFKGKIEQYRAGTSAGDRIYLQTIMPAELNDIPFKLEKRLYPIEMNFPQEVSIIMDLGIPAGYKIESLPEPIRYVTQQDGLQVIYNASPKADRLNITMKYIAKQLFFEADDYETLKHLFNQRHEKFNEQIVLVKS